MKPYILIVALNITFVGCADDKNESIMVETILLANDFIQNENNSLEYQLNLQRKIESRDSIRKIIERVMHAGEEIREIIDSVQNLKKVNTDFLAVTSNRLIHASSINDGEEVKHLEINHAIIKTYTDNPIVVINNLLQLENNLYAFLLWHMNLDQSDQIKLPMFKIDSDRYFLFVRTEPVYYPFPVKLSITTMKYGDTELNPDRYAIQQENNIAGILVNFSDLSIDTTKILSAEYKLDYFKKTHSITTDQKGTLYFRANK